MEQIEPRNVWFHAKTNNPGFQGQVGGASEPTVAEESRRSSSRFREQVRQAVRGKSKRVIPSSNGDPSETNGRGKCELAILGFRSKCARKRGDYIGPPPY